MRLRWAANKRIFKGVIVLNTLSLFKTNPQHILYEKGISTLKLINLCSLSNTFNFAEIESAKSVMQHLRFIPFIDSKLPTVK